MSGDRLSSLEELTEAIDIGLDIEFYLYDIRYNISVGEKGPFICICPDGDAIYYKDGRNLVEEHEISDKSLKAVWEDIIIRSM